MHTFGSQSRESRPVVLVVGGSSGIGLAAARLLTESSGGGVVVALGARDDEALGRAALEVGGDPLVVPVDVTDEASVKRCVAAVFEAHGRLDGVITTAQVMAYGTVEQVPSEVFDHVVDTAIKGTAHLARAVLPVFRAQGHGTLVVVSSLLARIAVPSLSAYNAAKWGQLGLVRALQLELRDASGVHVCLVSPGAVDTPIYEQAATYAGSSGSAPPPVVSAERVAQAAVGCLGRPRRHVDVGPVNALAVLGFRLLPPVYDRLAGPLVRHVVLRGPGRSPDPGNVLVARPEREGVSGGWTVTGRLRTSTGRPHWRRRRSA